MYVRNALRGHLGGLVVAAAIGVLGVSAAQAAGNWPGWRGPNLNGTAEATHLPARWSESEGIVWKTQLPGSGSATPAVWGERIFLNSVNAQTGRVEAICVHADDGRILWRRAHGPNRRQGRNDMTSPSPVTDGQRVIFLFGTGEMVAYDMDGAELWKRDLEEDFRALSWLFGYGASPLLYEGRLYLQLMRRPTHRNVPEDEPLTSYLVAIDPQSGRDLWRQERPGEARAESWESYITPIPHVMPEGVALILAGADAITGHDPQTGRELWRYDFNAPRRGNWRLVPTPVSAAGRIYQPMPRGGTMVAFRPSTEQPRAALEDVAEWELTRNAPDVCSPLLYDGRLYVLDGDQRVMTCLDPQTGEPIWRGELGGRTVIRSSPTAADGKIYFIDEAGVAFVLAAGDEFRKLAEIPMGGGEAARASIVIAQNRLYIRTADALYAIAAE